MTARYIVSDVFDGLATLEDGSVDLVVTSPPFLALRSYLPADDPLKAKEIGSEPTPAVFLDVMLRFTAELRRVLAPHGSICIELGDTYAGSGGAGGDYLNAGLREGQPGFDGSASRGRTQDREYDGGASDRWDFAKPGTNSRLAAGAGWPLAKSKTLIPELYRIALAYGINPLTGAESPAGQWRIRNVVTWARPNPPVGALGDKWRPATSDVVVACVSGKRYWDDLATRKATNDSHATSRASLNRSGIGYHTGDDTDSAKPISNLSTGAPLLDYWEIPLDPDEEPRRYGPKEKGPDPAQEMLRPRMGPKHTDQIGSNTVSNPSGAPLLDYWEIPLLDGDEERRYGPKEKGMPYRIPNGPKAATPSEDHGRGTYGFTERIDHNLGGSPLLDYWVIPPGGYEGSHYAVFPPELVVPLVKAMTPERVCRECGEPSRRIVAHDRPQPESNGAYQAGRLRAGGDFPSSVVTEYETTGWTDCGHNDYRPGLVLDPFAGSGTTLLVATGHGHDAVGIDLDSRNAELALQRVGPFLLEVV